MKAAVLVFPGSNREGDVAQAIELVTGRRPQMVWHGDGDFEKTDLIVLPGGFSYGDYLRCGAMAAQSPVMVEVKKRAAQGVPVLAICANDRFFASMSLRLSLAEASTEATSYIELDPAVDRGVVQNEDPPLGAFTQSKRYALCLHVAGWKPHLFEGLARGHGQRNRRGELLPDGLQCVEVGVAPFLLLVGGERSRHQAAASA